MNIRLAAALLLTTLLGSRTLPADEVPLARIAVIANPYITTLRGDQITDESGRQRDFLAKTAPASMEKTVSLVNRLKPDALVVLGSLTWSGSQQDFDALRKFLDRIEAPIFATTGHRDRAGPSQDVVAGLLGSRNAMKQVRSVNGVSLAFADELHVDPDAATKRLKRQLSTSKNDKAILLFAARDRTMGRSRLSKDHDFWELVEKKRIAVRLEPTRYGHFIGYEKQLPVWTAGSTGWSTGGAVTLVTVYADRIELAEMADPNSPAFSLSVPNPVNAARMATTEDDPFASPSFTADRNLKPDFTFALVSDPQFDRERNRAYLIEKAEAAIEELNRLSPAMVFVAGDLVNNNLPEEWAIFNRVFGRLKPRRYAVPGNHDVLFNYDFVEKSYASAPEQKPQYAEIVRKAVAKVREEGFSGPTALYEKYTGSKPRQMIEHRDCAFITVPFLTTRADPEQIEFLKKQLNGATAKKHVFVIGHYPALPAFGNNLQPTLGGGEVLSLLHQHSVTGYLFGHRHRNGFRLHERTAHVLTDNMGTIHLFHVFPDRVIIGRKRVGSPLYEKLVAPSPR